MMITWRGLASDATRSAAVSAGTNSPSWPCCSINALVFAYDRLCTATLYPWRARLRARLLPIVARPVTAMRAVPSVLFAMSPSLPYQLK
jgi:hypothetical protein